MFKTTVEPNSKLCIKQKDKVDGVYTIQVYQHDGVYTIQVYKHLFKRLETETSRFEEDEKKANLFTQAIL